MSNQWLYKQIKNEDSKINPKFSMQSTLNWMNSLSFEVKHEHGETIEEQIKSCKKLLSKTSNKQKIGNIVPIFEPMFHSITFSVALVSMSESNAYPWMFSNAIISWYYSVYNSFKAILASLDGRETDTHSGMIKALIGEGIRSKLPHPFNMIAERKKGENYSVYFPNYIDFDRRKSVLTSKFDNTTDTAKSMILEYLNGTTKFECTKVKNRIKNDKKLNIKDFRTEIAQQTRDNKLSSEVNFLHCAFRYRGKANYRDSIFLSYGSNDLRLDDNFMKNLSTVANFILIFATIYIEKRIGKEKTKLFLDDIKNNFRGQELATKEELFWHNLI